MIGLSFGEFPVKRTCACTNVWSFMWFFSEEECSSSPTQVSAVLFFTSLRRCNVNIVQFKYSYLMESIWVKSISSTLCGSGGLRRRAPRVSKIPRITEKPKLSGKFHYRLSEAKFYLFLGLIDKLLSRKAWEAGNCHGGKMQTFSKKLHVLLRSSFLSCFEGYIEYTQIP